MPPTLTNGKICYIEIPATDIARSADFYKRVFGWHIRKRGDGSTAFDDTTGQVSGTWVLGRSPATAPGLLVYIMVDSVAAAVDAVVANGGQIAQRKRDWPLPATRLTAILSSEGLLRTHSHLTHLFAGKTRPVVSSRMRCAGNRSITCRCTLDPAPTDK